ncbi:MAG: SMC-Scp complex subunit ScpB [Actinobacteria bacterium]|nr:SMC-Scp complex subunit ScpB [Actinomycetota bacterium]
MAQETVRAIEAILMVAQESVPAQLIAELVEIPVARVEEICGVLASVYEDAGHGFQVAKVAGGWRFQSHPDLANYVERFVLEGQRTRLSGAALETLAIIAYKQPISRLQIASIRGVDPEAVMRTLHGRGYIAPVGRDSGPGLAVMWGTTPLFLDKLGLASLEDMPPISSFVPDASLVEALEQTLRLEPGLELDSDVDHAAPSPDGD